MENQKDIELVKIGVVLKPKGDEIIKRLNIPWEVKIDPEALVSEAVVNYGENKISISIKFNTVDLIACDENGNQKTYTLPGFAQDEFE